MRVAVIGCGLIGRKRALALGKDDRLVACCDIDRAAGQRFAREFSCNAFIDHRSLLDSVENDAIIVAVVNKFARDIVIDGLKSGRHVLAEKPLGRDAREAREMAEHSSAGPSLSGDEAPVAREGLCSGDGGPTGGHGGFLLKVGFNHRFHPAIRKAKDICDTGGIGRILSIRARYGHGGRPGMEKEWRASRDLCGGGELLDQGVHVIDLVRWFGGEIAEVYGRVETTFWPMDVEDGAMAVMKTGRGVTASFHVSWTNWKNIFSFEVFGADGYVRVEGLGGSYGRESLEYGRRRPEGGVPDTEYEEFPPEDVSWRDEWKEFLSAVRDKRRPVGDAIDGLRANEVVEALYESSRAGRVVELGVVSGDGASRAQACDLTGKADRGQPATGPA